ncbi:hypothetical protein F5Y17DRAFT_472938 [Xylariaceae sp. FL0594]|nr:hypothetical protein F5Y17DRAFT_472938 [Xylariaceae sp. FL0594]
MRRGGSGKRDGDLETPHDLGLSTTALLDKSSSNASALSPVTAAVTGNLNYSTESSLTTGLGLHVIHEPKTVSVNLLFLPSEQDMDGARICTFGYNANWHGTTKTIASITDFAKELLYEMRFGKDRDGKDLDLASHPTIFVTHSMGGLVVKKAYLQGLLDSTYQRIVRAVSAVVFLSTPHRGSHLAAVLHRNSAAIEDLNEQFRHVSPNLSIWSFYETSATAIGPRKLMVVDKESPMHADHHNVCKFSSPADPNYVAVKNAIRSLTPETVAGSTVGSDVIDVEDFFRGVAESLSREPHVLWYAAPPANGKSVLSAYSCQFFFFSYSDASKRRVESCIGSLAFLVFKSDRKFADLLPASRVHDLGPESSNPFDVWHNPLYWIIDALDECDTPEVLFQCLESLPVADAPRISQTVKTSHIREPGRLQRELPNLKGSDDFKQKLLQNISRRADGNLLWVNLSIQAVFEQSMLHCIRQSEKLLIKSILEWTTCAQRPLSLKELSQAIQPDFAGFLDLKRTVQETCGQMLHVNTDHTISFLHYTVREHLTCPSDSDLFIDLNQTHEKLFMRTLAGFRDLDLRCRSADDVHPLAMTEPFLLYSAVSWPFHLSSSGSSSDGCLDMLLQVFRSVGVLSWIHVLGLLGRLDILTQASDAVAAFVTNIRSRDTLKGTAPSREPDMELLSEWTVALLKLLPRFASKILAKPEVVYYTIPAICPPQTVLHRQFHSMANIRVTGLPDYSWNDNLCRITLADGTYNAHMICSAGLFAVRPNFEKVHVWSSTDYNEMFSIEHGETLCTVGPKTTKLWSALTGELKSSTQNPVRSKMTSLVFAENDGKLISSDDSNRIRSIQCDNFRQGWQVLIDEFMYFGSSQEVVFNSDRTQFAAASLHIPLSVWRLRDGRRVHEYKKVSWSGVDQPSRSQPFEKDWTVVKRFTWNYVTGHIIGVHRLGNVFKWHPSTDERVEAYSNSFEIACSANGKLFATASNNATVYVWDFASFRVIHKFWFGDMVVGLMFSPDSRRLYGLGSACVDVWDPYGLDILLGHRINPTNRNKGIPPPRRVDHKRALVSGKSDDEYMAVTALSVAPGGRSYCAGYDNGEVEHFHTGSSKGTSFTSFLPLWEVTCIQWGRDGRIVAATNPLSSFDVHIVDCRRKLEETLDLPPSSVECKTCLNQKPSCVDGLVISPDGKLYLTSTKEGAAVACSALDGNLYAETSVPAHIGRGWLSHPTRGDILLRCGPHRVDAYRWSTLELTWSASYIDMPPGYDATVHGDDHGIPIVDRAMATQDGSYLLIQVRKTLLDEKSSLSVTVLPISALTGDTPDKWSLRPASVIHIPSEVTSRMFTSLGSFRFSNYNNPKELYRRFYFIPADWAMRETLRLCVMSEDGTLFCPMDDRVVHIKCVFDESRLGSLF